MNTALLIIDAQVNMFEPNPVFRAEEVLGILKGLVSKARAAGTSVIFLRNNGGDEDPDRQGTPGWELHPTFGPLPDEPIIDKHTPDSFYQTKLAGVLASQGIKRLVVAGMQTEYCIDTTCRRAFSQEYAVTLVSDGHSTYSGVLSAEQIIAHHNHILSSFATLCPFEAVDFAQLPPPSIQVDSLSPFDLAAIASGLEEWKVFDHWLATDEGLPFWPHSHPGKVADTLKQLWKPDFKPQHRYLDPPRWGLGLAHTFFQPLENIPMAFRRNALSVVSKAIDHLLQNPRNPLSPHIRQVGEQVWLYDARDLRLFYVPHVTHDRTGNERRYIFLLWMAPGIPVQNPFA